MGTFFKKTFEEKTGGKHKIDLFPNGQLGSEENTVSNAQMGLLDFSLLAINNVTPFSPTVGVLTLPYVILSAEDAKKLVTGDVGKELTANTVRDAGIRIVGWTFTGFRVLTNSKRPVRTMEDLKGLKIRVPKNEIMIASYNAWGINPTPMAWSETFTALQQGVVDGQDNPYMTVWSMKFNEVQKYITPIRYVFSLEPLIVSEAIFKKQPADVQKAILEAGAESTEHSYKFLGETEDKIKKELLAKGMEIDHARERREGLDRQGDDGSLAQVLQEHRRQGKARQGVEDPRPVTSARPPGCAPCVSLRQPLAGGDAGGPAEPAPRRLLDFGQPC